MNFEVVHPLWLAAGVALTLVAALLPFWGHGAGRDLTPLRRRWVIAVRCVIWLFLWAAFAGARELLPSDRLTVFFLVDRSLSTRRQEGFARKYLSQCLPLQSEHQNVAIITFGGDAMLEVPPTHLNKLPPFTATVSRNETDIAGAIRFACAGLPANSSGRLVLLSDGQETRGDALPEIEMAHRMGIETAVVPFPENAQAEVLVESLKVPDKVRPRAPFEIGATIQSTQEGSECDIVLERNSHPAVRQHVRLQKGKNFFLLPQKSDRADLLHYRLRIESPADTEMANNQAEATVIVEGPPRVLYITKAVQPDLVAQLRNGGQVVDVTRPSNLPEDLSSWQSYQAVILDNVSALDLSTIQIEWLSALIREAGVGLTMIGGPDSFGAGGYYGTSLAEALPVSLDIRRKKDTPASAMIFLIDKSGSMSEKDGAFEKMAMAREAAIASVEMMSNQDEVGVIAFDEAFKWVVNLQRVEHPEQIVARISTLRAGGGTSLYGGLEAAIFSLAGDPSPVKHALVLTDGLVEPANFKALSERARRAQITISTVAVGNDADIKFLAQLAKDGKGRSYLATSASMLPRVFARDTVLASRSAFVEKPSRPAPAESHAIMRGIDVSQAPPLLGYNLVSAKGAPHQLLLAVGEDPILAVGRFGLGKVVAFTADSGARWSKNWALWPPYAQMLQQAVRWSLPETESSKVQYALEPGLHDRLLVTATLAQGMPMPQLQAGIISPSGQTARVAFKQTGPRRFQTELAADQPGSWLIHASAGGSADWTRSFSVPYSSELASVGSDIPRLQALAAAAEGLFNPEPSAVMAPLKSPRRFSEDLWPRLVMFALLLLPLEVALRRVSFAWRFRRNKSAAMPEATPQTSQRLLAKKRQLAPSSRPPALPMAPLPDEASPPRPRATVASEEDAMTRLKRAKQRGREN